MEYDKNLKDLWIRRLTASIIDFIITFAVAVGVLYYLWPNMETFDLVLAFFFQGFIWYVYSIPFDYLWGKTPGKMFTKIKAVSFVGDLSLKQVVLRNLTKLNVILVISDAVAGLSTEGDPRQRYTERFIDSIIVEDKKWEKKKVKKKTEGVEERKKKSEAEELVLPE